MQSLKYTMHMCVYMCVCVYMYQVISVTVWLYVTQINSMPDIVNINLYQISCELIKKNI